MSDFQSQFIPKYYFSAAFLTLFILSPNLTGGDVTFQELAKWGNSSYDHMVRTGDHALAANGNNGLDIIDLSDPNHPNVIRTLDLPGFAQSTLVVSDIAYVSLGKEGIAIIDISTPSQARVISARRFNTDVATMAIHGDHVIVVMRYGFIAVLDISQPALPREVGFSDPPDGYFYTKSMTIIDDIAYLGTEKDIHAYDLSETNPRKMFTTELDVSRNLISYGSYLIAYERFNNGDYYQPKIAIYQPTVDTLEMVGQLILDVEITSAYFTAVVENYLYLPLGYPGVSVVDLSEPNAPVEAARIPVEGKMWGLYPESGLFIDTRRGWGMLDMSNPAQPVFETKWDHPYSLACPVLVGEHLFVLDSLIRGIRSFDMDESGEVSLFGSVSLPNALSHVSLLDNGYLFANDSDTGFNSRGPWLIDITDPGNPTQVNDLAIQYGFAPRVSGNTAYYYKYWSEDEGIKILDLTDPLQPQPLGEQGTGPVYLEDFTVHGTNAHLYYQDENFNNKILNFDFSNPTQTSHPKSVTNLWWDEVPIAMEAGPGRLNMTFKDQYVVRDFDGSEETNRRELNMPSHDIEDMAASGDLVVTLSDRKLNVHDLSQPTGTLKVGQAPILEDNSRTYRRAVYLKDHVAIVATSAIMAFDLSQPEKPSELAAITEYAHQASFMRENLLYGFFYRNGSTQLVIVDFANPSQPQILSETPVILQNPTHIALDGNRLYTVDLYGDPAMTYDVENPHDPQVIGAQDNVVGQGIVVQAGYAYISVHDALDVYEIVDDQLILKTSLPLGPFSFSRMLHDGQTLYMGRWSSLRVIDLSEPGAPALLYSGSFRTDLELDHLDLVGNRLLTGFDTTIAMIDVRDLSSPACISHTELVEEPGAIFDLGSIVLVDHESSAAVYDLSDPDRIIELGRFPLDCSLTGAQLRDNHLVITDCGKVRVLELLWLENLIETWPKKSVIDMIHPLEVMPPPTL